LFFIIELLRLNDKLYIYDRNETETTTILTRLRSKCVYANEFLRALIHPSVCEGEREKGQKNRNTTNE